MRRRWPLSLPTTSAPLAPPLPPAVTLRPLLHGGGASLSPPRRCFHGGGSSPSSPQRRRRRRRPARGPGYADPGLRQISGMSTDLVLFQPEPRNTTDGGWRQHNLLWRRDKLCVPPKKIWHYSENFDY